MRARCVEVLRHLPPCRPVNALRYTGAWDRGFCASSDVTIDIVDVLVVPVVLLGLVSPLGYSVPTEAVAAHSVYVALEQHFIRDYL